MRSIPIIAIGVTIIIYFILSLIGYINISIVFKKKSGSNKILRIIYCIYSFLVLFVFIYLFVYPGNAAESTDYRSFLIFNVILVADIFSKFTLTVFSIPYFVLKIFHKTRKIFLYAGMIVACGIIVSVIYGAVIGRKHLQVKSVEIEYTNLPDSFDGFNLVQLSDIHLGSFLDNQGLLERAVNKINSLDPDLVLFTGDLVNNFSKETVGWGEVFSKIKTNYGRYSILGNHDYGDYYNWDNENEKNENFESIINSHKKYGFNLLRNESVAIVAGNDSIYLSGVENWGHPPFPQYADLNKALKDIPENLFNILMTHDPAHWENVKKLNENIELALSGHTHGLQWGIKPAGIEISLIYLGSKNWGGLYGFEDQYLYVNGGFGTIGLNFRLDMPAEITLITLRKK
ncbi:MAG: metallophosphoesterase, partial [Mariniphaga sp.]|nr:metallophosphoesterase [Mariniphaga sp.]